MGSTLIARLNLLSQWISLARLSFGATAIILVLMGCSNNDSPEVSPTGLSSQTAIAVTGPTPTATDSVPLATIEPVTPVPVATHVIVIPTATPLPLPFSSLPLDQLETESCSLRGDYFTPGLSGNGTAPGPTPTPVPELELRDPVFVRAEVFALRRSMDSITLALEDYDRQFRVSWLLAATPEAQAALLQTYSMRLVQLCDAVSQLSIPPEMFGPMVQIAEAMRSKNSWLKLAADEVSCCGDANTEFLASGASLTESAIAESLTSISSAFGTYDPSPGQSTDRFLQNAQLGLTLELDELAIVRRSALDIVVTYVSTDPYLELKSTGPNNWIGGEGLRIRRLRAGNDATLEEAISNYLLIVSAYGEVVRMTGPDVAGFPTLEYTYQELQNDWVGSNTAFLFGDHVYIVETMCDPAAGSCGLIEAVKNSIQTTTG